MRGKMRNQRNFSFTAENRSPNFWGYFCFAQICFQQLQKVNLVHGVAFYFKVFTLAKVSLASRFPYSCSTVRFP